MREIVMILLMIILCVGGYWGFRALTKGEIEKIIFKLFIRLKLSIFLPHLFLKYHQKFPCQALHCGIHICVE